jgi:ankyrin repeat protein
MMAACMKGHLEVMKQLRDAGADLSKADDDGNTALYYSVFYKIAAATELLMTAGSVPTTRNNNGVSPIDLAMSQNNEEALKFLHEY